MVTFKAEAEKIVEKKKVSTSQTLRLALRLVTLWFSYASITVIGFGVVILTLIHGLRLEVYSWWWLIAGFLMVSIILPGLRSMIAMWFTAENE